ncbi:MAG: hypothetical protein WCI36_01625 [bacterium]
MQLFQKHYKKILFFLVNILIIVGGVFLIKNISQKNKTAQSTAEVNNKNAPPTKATSATTQSKQPYTSSTTKVS